MPDPRLETLARNVGDALTSAIARKNPGLTHVQLQPIIGVSQFVISRAKNGKLGDAQLSTLLKLADYCETTIDRLLGVQPAEDERLAAAVRRVLDERERGGEGGR